MTARPFGTLPDGSQVDAYSLTGDAIELRAITYGGIITSLTVPDRYGTPEDVVLGHSSLGSDLANGPYFGAIVGRYANRIANGRFVLDGVEHQLARNDVPNHLHGGLKGFDQYNWQASPIAAADGVGVTFTRTSPAGEEHYPATLTISTTEPGLQFYDGHLLDGTTIGAYGPAFGRHAGLCLERSTIPTRRITRTSPLSSCARRRVIARSCVGNS